MYQILFAWLCPEHTFLSLKSSIMRMTLQQTKVVVVHTWGGVTRMHPPCISLALRFHLKLPSRLVHLTYIGNWHGVYASIFCFEFIFSCTYYHMLSVIAPPPPPPPPPHTHTHTRTHKNIVVHRERQSIITKTQWKTVEKILLSPIDNCYYGIMT